MVTPAARSSLRHILRFIRKAWTSPPFRHHMSTNERWRAFLAYALFAMNSWVMTCHRSLAVLYCLTSSIVASGSRLFSKFRAIWSSRSQFFASCFSVSVGLSMSLGTGRGSEPSKWPHRQAVSMASWKWALKMAQFAPSESRCGTSADSCSICGVEDVVGDMATKRDDKDKEAEDRAEDNVDDADEETALVLE